MIHLKGRDLISENLDISFLSVECCCDFKALKFASAHAYDSDDTFFSINILCH